MAHDDDSPITELDLPTRVMNTLRRPSHFPQGGAGCETIGDLRKWVDREDDRWLGDLPYFGLLSIDRTVAALRTWDSIERVA